MRHVFLASRNAKKLTEMERILREHAPDIAVVGLDDVAAYDDQLWRDRLATTNPTYVVREAGSTVAMAAASSRSPMMRDRTVAAISRPTTTLRS